MTRATWIAGTLAASLAAGPIVAAQIALISAAAQPMRPWSGLALFPLAMILALPVGLLVSLIPNIGCTALLAAIGSRHQRARDPVVWVVAGFAIGWMLSLATIGPWLPAGAVLAVTGAVCALICRHGTVWAD